MDAPYQAAKDVYVLPTHLPIPGVGAILINSFVILAEEPVLVDTGIGTDRQEFVDALTSILDPVDLRWLWLTHDDADHTGSVERVLELCPNALLATHGFNALRMANWWPVPLQQVQALTADTRLDVGDRTLRAIRPPLFDNPFSLGIYDEKSGALFSVDAFGAVLPGEPGQSAVELSETELTEGMIAWATFDSPWAHLVDTKKFDEVVDHVQRLGPSSIYSSHLPAATGPVEPFLKVLKSVPTAEPFVAPDQAAFEAMLAGM
ncbi:MAG: MBL fold metallo-hydrolase [Actinomycetota bacterium]|nr:MBL fold metallo-hydrolase [Actinomycetota bacterium]